MEEADLIRKLRLIEALHPGATTPGEKAAAGNARERIRAQLDELEREAPPVEYTFTMADMWSRKLFVALLRRYDIRPYRYKRQRYTTVMARANKHFVEETLWPQYEALSKTLHSYLSDVTDRVIGEVLHQESSEAEVVDSPRGLPQGKAGAGT